MILLLSLFACNLTADPTLPSDTGTEPTGAPRDSATDSADAPRDSATTPQAPQVRALSPLDGQQVRAGAQVELRAWVSDPQSPPQDLQLSVSSLDEGQLCVTWGQPDNEAACLLTLPPGEALLELTVRDRDGNQGWASLTLEALDPVQVDDDGDGYSEAEGDCDDFDADVRPGAADTPYDGVDQDCDGEDLCDVDGDGALHPLCGGDDCDDTNPGASPSGVEVAYDGVDQDCDGYDLCDVDGDGHQATACGGDDCYDANADAYPGASGWHGADRGDGSYDYDCDGVESVQYPDQYCTSGSNPGWLDEPPSCGTYEAYVSTPVYIGHCMPAGIAFRTQTCR